MWTRWFPWRWIIKNLAKKHGFIDPINLVAAMNRVAQPSEVAAPVELLRLAAVLHARGLINSQIIQNNLDWLWPYWVQEQYDPRRKSFVPRAFSLTHINLTHRNWTAVGVPGVDSFSIVDPRGLVTAHYDGWSLDSWLETGEDKKLVPSRSAKTKQTLEMLDNLSVLTDVSDGKNYLTSRVEVETERTGPFCRVTFTASTQEKGVLVVSLRPFNPEGVSFVHKVEKTSSGWMVNGKDKVIFDDFSGRNIFSNYQKGDVFNRISFKEEMKKVRCDVGLCTAAMVFNTEPGKEYNVTLKVPLEAKRKQGGGKEKKFFQKWPEVTAPVSRLDIPDEKFKFLYETSVRNLILFSPEEILAGPYTYRSFWFRDAVFAISAMLAVNLHDHVEDIIGGFLPRQTASGYFRSQDGEWDSNGQVLWIMNRYCDLSGREPVCKWIPAVKKAIEWILKKRISGKTKGNHSGLFPPGFSAEHFGPNDYYYWDDFWGVAGLDAGISLLKRSGAEFSQDELKKERDDFFRSVNHSIKKAREEQNVKGIPSSPNRRMDSSSVGVLVSSYPLGLYSPEDAKIKETLDYLIENDFLNGLFFHEIAHSGINIYLSLQIAQVLLRRGDDRYFSIMSAAAEAASPTGQWPEAIHPWTGGGCMGDGQHLWASSEWVMMMRNIFVREEGNTLILCSGLPAAWIDAGQEMFFGPAPTVFGTLSVKVCPGKDGVTVSLESEWRKNRPFVEVRIPGYEVKEIGPQETAVYVPRGEK